MNCMETSLTPAQQEVEMTLHLHGPSILNLIGSTFYKLGGDEHWAGRGSAPATLFRRIFNWRICKNGHRLWIRGIGAVDSSS
jgi:hypothetical protein